MSGIANFLFGGQKRAHGSEEDQGSSSKKLSKTDPVQKRAQGEDQDPSNPSTKVPKLDLGEPISLLATKLGEDELYELFERMSLPALAVLAQGNKDFAKKVRDYLEHKAQMVVTSIDSTVCLMKEKEIFDTDQFNIDSTQDLLSLEDGEKKDEALLENLKDLLNAVCSEDHLEKFAKTLLRGLSPDPMKKIFLKKVIELTQQKLKDPSDESYVELEDHPERFERLFDQIHSLIHHENILTPCERVSLLSNFHRAWIEEGESEIDQNFREVPQSLREAIKSLASNLVRNSKFTSREASFFVKNVCKADVYFNEDSLKRPIYFISPQILQHTFSEEKGDLFIEPLLIDLIEVLKDQKIPRSLICSVYISLLNISQTFIDRNRGPDRRDLFLKGILDHIDSIEDRSAYLQVLGDLLIILEDFGHASIKSQIQAKVREIVASGDPAEVCALNWRFTMSGKYDILLKSLAEDKFAKVRLNWMGIGDRIYINVEDFEKLVGELGLTALDLKEILSKDKKNLVKRSSGRQLIESYLKRLKDKEFALDLFLSLVEDNSHNFSYCYIDLFRYLLNQIPKEKQVESVEKFMRLHPFFNERQQNVLQDLIFCLEDQESQDPLLPLFLSKIEDRSLFWYRRFDKIGSQGSKERLYEILKKFDQLLKYESTPMNSYSLGNCFDEIYKESDAILNSLDPAEASEILFQTLLMFERAKAVVFSRYSSRTLDHIKKQILSKIDQFSKKIEDLDQKRVFLERTESRFGKLPGSFCSIQ